MTSVRRSERLRSGINTSPRQTRISVWDFRNHTNQTDKEFNPENINDCDLWEKMENEERITTPKRNGKIKALADSKKRELIRKLQRSDSVINVSDDVSPPKQAKSENVAKEQLLTPSRLMNRLNIDESDSDTESQEAGKNVQLESGCKFNKYQNARRILSSTDTETLPGREVQLTELKEYLREHLEDKRSGSLYISGQPGTGKTACLSLLLRSHEFRQHFKSVYVNCTSLTSRASVYKKLCNELNLKPSGRTERDHLVALENFLKQANNMILLVLDEIDQLCTVKQTVLYTIFEWPSLPNVQLLLVGIANSLDLTERTLMRLNTRCGLKPKHMHFPPYTKQQIVDIFKARLEDADVLELFPPATLQLLAAKVSAVSGDIRRALDIGRRVVEIAEQQRKAGTKEIDLNELKLDDDNASTLCNKDEDVKPVQVTQVAAVLNTVYGISQNLQEDIEESFPLQQKVMLCSLMLMLSKERNKDITMGRLYEVYRRVCSKRHIQSLDQTEFFGLVDLVQTRGILRLIKKKEMRVSKIQLLWDEEEINGALKDKQLIASILHDTACLNK